MSLVTLDLHRFKEVNDQLGHPRGDDVLRAVASTLTRSLRTSDFAFRIGGDEFSLLLPQTDAAQAFALAKRISVIFSEVLHTLKISIQVSMDHGIATYSADGETVEQLIQVADDRLYRLKHANHGKPGLVSDSGKDTKISSQSVAATLSEPPPPRSTPTPEQGSSAAQPLQPEKRALIEIPRSTQSSESSLAAAVTSSTATMQEASSTAGIQSRPIFSVQRKAERVSMTGTNAYAVLNEVAAHRARVLDLGFGGVALELESKLDLPDNFLAVLHVPILPPVRVNLRPIWSRPTADGSFRVGCCFVS